MFEHVWLLLPVIVIVTLKVKIIIRRASPEPGWPYPSDYAVCPESAGLRAYCAQGWRGGCA